MNTKDQKIPATDHDGLVELDEALLTEVTGGASLDYILTIDGIKGDSESKKPTPGGINVLLGDGSVRIGDGSVRK